MAAGFKGDVEARWISHAGADRDMMLLTSFTFTDAAGLAWVVPKGTVVNGASIPQIFWTSFGPPFVGDYRRASVVHDHYCVVKTRSSHDTHRMFREACLAGGVSSAKAGAMYLAVRTFGPNWMVLAESMALPNFNSLALGGGSSTADDSAPADGDLSLDRLPSGATLGLATSMSLDDYSSLRKWIETADPSVEEIDARANAATKVFPAVEIPAPGF